MILLLVAAIATVIIVLLFFVACGIHIAKYIERRKELDEDI